MMTDIIDKQPVNIGELLEERKILVEQKLELSKQLAAMGISGNRAYYQRGTIDKKVWEERTALATKVTEIEQRLSAIRQVLKTQPQREIDRVREIIIEEFGLNYWIAVDLESKKRKNGGEPTRIKPPTKKIQPKEDYKGKLLDAVSMLIKARAKITKYIMENEPEINKADYLLKVKELNSVLPSISEIEKMKP
jgi:hypothetical protein